MKLRRTRAFKGPDGDIQPFDLSRHLQLETQKPGLSLLLTHLSVSREGYTVIGSQPGGVLYVATLLRSTLGQRTGRTQADLFGSVLMCRFFMSALHELFKCSYRVWSCTSVAHTPVLQAAGLALQRGLTEERRVRRADDCVGEKCRNKGEAGEYHKRGSFPAFAAAQLACCGRARAGLLHAEHLNAGNGSFRSFNGATVFVCESEREGGKRRDGR